MDTNNKSIEMKFYTYIYKDPSRNNEIIYVGKGNGRRAYVHLKRKDKHPMTQRIQYMKKNGVEPIIEFLCKNVDEEFALFCEEEAISHYGRKDLYRGPLLNLTNGGESETGRKLSQTQLEKRIGKFKGENNPFYGKTHSLESKELMRGENHPLFGKHHSEETKKKMGGKKPIIICPHCNKTGGFPIMYRYHFDNCKEKP